MWLEMFKYYGLCEWIFSGRVLILPVIVSLQASTTNITNMCPSSYTHQDTSLPHNQFSLTPLLHLGNLRCSRSRPSALQWWLALISGLSIRLAHLCCWRSRSWALMRWRALQPGLCRRLAHLRCSHTIEALGAGSLPPSRLPPLITLSTTD
jgi:hypothetical protein